MRPGNVEEMLDNCVVHDYGTSNQRVYFGDRPLGRKLQAKGHRCSEGGHDFFIDRYPRVPKAATPHIPREYVDKVCRNCTRRVPVK